MRPITIYELQSLSRESSGLYCRMKEEDLGTLEHLRLRILWLDAERRLNEAQIEYFNQPDSPKPGELPWNMVEMEVSNAVN